MLTKSWKERKRGIFLLSILFLAMVATMFIGAAIAIAPSSLGRSRSQSQQATAQRAAQTGVEYALMRLRANLAWNSPGNVIVPNTVTVDSNNFTVVEEQGNVVGTLTDIDGTVSQFRLRFNWQNGTPTPDPDGLADPSPAMWIDFPYVSVNNVDSSIDTIAPQVSGPNSSVTASPTTRFVVPAHTCLLAVQGRCGSALASATLSAPNPTASLGSGALSSTVVETLYQCTSMGPAIIDAAAMADGNVSANFDTNQALQITANQSQTPRIRTKSEVNVTNSDDGSSVTIAGSGTQIYDSGLGAQTKLSSQVTNKGTDTGGFYNLPWSQVHQAGNTNEVAAGTYVVRSSGLYYFAMGYSDYSNYIQSNPTAVGLPVSLPPSITASGGGTTLTVTSDTKVVPGTNTSEFNYIPDRGVDQGPGAQPVPLSKDVVNGALYGSGGVVDLTRESPNLNTPAQASFLAAVGSWFAGAFGANSPLGTYSGNNFNNLGGNGGGAIEVSVGGPVNNFNSQAQTAFSSIIQMYLQAHPEGYGQFQNAALTAVAPLPSTLPAGGLIPGVTSNVVPQNLKLNFAPVNTTSAVLSVAGNTTLGSQLSGQGGSVVANGTVSLQGMGVNLAASPNAADGVSLYSTQNIFINTWNRNSSAYGDVSLKGIVYALGSINATLADPTVATSGWGKFQLTGTIVADSSGGAGTGVGNISLTAESGNLTFDPGYLVGVMQTLPTNPAYAVVWWDQH